MKKNFTLFVAALVLTSVAYGQKTVEVSMGPQYANDVFFGLENETQKTVDRNAWDISFYRKSNFDMGIRINDGKGIEVFEASDDIEDWNTISLANVNDWTPLYNSDISWKTGAFDNGSAAYGWGVYQMSNHHVVGSVVFVLKYQTGEYIKFKMNNFFGGYNFTYSKWNGSAWEADVKKEVPNNTSTNRLFNYFNFASQSVVDVEPVESEWDLKFTKYITPLQAGDETVMYTVTGVLQNETVTVAKDEASNAYSANINAIGYDWKTYSFTEGYIINPNPYFIKKTATNKVYKLTFNEFAGSSTGKVKFTYEDAKLGLSDVKDQAVGIFTTNSPKTFQVVLNGKNDWTQPIEVHVYSIAGQLVHQENYKASSNFSTKTIQVNQAPKGVYIVKVKAGNSIESKKIIFK